MKCHYCDEDDKRMAVTALGPGTTFLDGTEIKGPLCVDCARAKVYKGKTTPRRSKKAPT